MAHTKEEIEVRRAHRRRTWYDYRIDTLAKFFANQRRQMTQTFWVDPLRDTTIRSKDGMRFFIPALAFEDRWGVVRGGRVKVEVIELTRKSDLILADRATTSGDRMLETGGAFFFNASQDNHPLHLRAAVEATIPISRRVDTPRYMAIFGGQSRGGRFDWVQAEGAQANLQVNTIDQIFNVTIRQPGWINCDHYYRLRMQQHYLLRLAPDPELAEQNVFLIYRTINTVTKMQLDDFGHFHFPAPVPLPSMIYSIGTANGHFFQGFHPIVQDPYQLDVPGEPEPMEVVLSMQPVEQESISSRLEKEIRFWDKEVETVFRDNLRSLRLRYRRWLNDRQDTDR